MVNSSSRVIIGLSIWSKLLHLDYLISPWPICTCLPLVRFSAIEQQTILSSTPPASSTPSPDQELVPDFHVRAESAPDHSARNDYVFIIADKAGIMDSEDDSYLSSVTTATALTATTTTTTSASSPSASSTTRTSAENHNNSNRTETGLGTGSSVGHAGTMTRHRGERRFPPVRPDTIAGSSRFRFQWLPVYRLRRQLLSRSSRFRGLN